MVNLTRIYTRTGDDGTTRLVDNSQVAKTDARLRAYADVDETNACVGTALALGQLPDDVRDVLLSVQNDLFDVGADLGNPIEPDPTVLSRGRPRTPQAQPLRVTQPYIDRLERWCDEYNERVEPLRSFVLPGGTPGAALLHVARTVARRAERSAWAAYADHEETMNVVALTYLNRLSDLLFILARVANADTDAENGGGDVLWEPGRGPAT